MGICFHGNSTAMTWVKQEITNRTFPYLVDYLSSFSTNQYGLNQQSVGKIPSQSKQRNKYTDTIIRQIIS